MKNIFTAVCILIGLFFFSCGEKKKDKPENLLDKEKMEAILSDCFLAESYIAAEYIGITDSEKRVQVQNLYANIFEKHGVTRQEYDESYAYFSREAKNMDEMFKNVVLALEQKKVEAKKKTIVSDSTATDIIVAVKE